MYPLKDFLFIKNCVKNVSFFSAAEFPFSSARGKMQLFHWKVCTGCASKFIFLNCPRHLCCPDSLTPFQTLLIHFLTITGGETKFCLGGQGIYSRLLQTGSAFINCRQTLYLTVFIITFNICAQKIRKFHLWRGSTILFTARFSKRKRTLKK